MDDPSASRGLRSRLTPITGNSEVEPWQAMLGHNSELARLHSFLGGSLTEKENAVTVLAMRGTTRDVLALLRSADAWTRYYAADYASANPRFDEIAPHLEDDSPFPNDAISGLRLQVDTRRRAALGSIPIQDRSWAVRSMLAGGHFPPGIVFGLRQDIAQTSAWQIDAGAAVRPLRGPD